jgi:hypothetical protein
MTPKNDPAKTKKRPQIFYKQKPGNPPRKKNSRMNLTHSKSRGQTRRMKEKLATALMGLIASAVISGGIALMLYGIGII